MIKKIFLILLCTIFLAGCSLNKKETLKFASWGSKTEVQILKSLISEFEIQNPDIDVEFLHIPQNYFQKIHLLLASNLAPDVIFINNLNIPVYEKYLLDLNPYIKDKTNYYPQVLDTMTYNNKLLALPRDVSMYVIFYNKDIFDKYNVPYPKPDWSMEDLLNTSVNLTKDGIFGISFEEEPQVYLPYLNAFGGGFLSSDLKLAINDEKSRQGINFYTDLRKKYNVAPKKHQSASETMAQMFLNKRLAMHLSGRWLVPKYRESADFNWDIINFPQFNGKSSVNIDSSGYAIIKSTDMKEQALRLVEFLSSEQSQKLFTETGLIVPARIDILNSDAFLDSKKPDNTKVFIDIIKTAEKTPVNKNYKEITDKINENLNYKFN